MRKGWEEAGRGRGREARSGVERRGDMRRYGAGPTVSTTTTEDPQEFLNEVRASAKPPLSSLSSVFCKQVPSHVAPANTCFLCVPRVLCPGTGGGILLQDVLGNRSV